MRTLRTLISLSVMICMVHGLSAGDAPAKIKFFRPSEPGSSYASDMEVEAKSVTVMTSEEGAKSEKTLCNKISISGIMTVLAVTEYGRPGSIEFKVGKISGDACGREVKFVSGGKVLQINLDVSPCEFRIKDGGGEIGKDEMLLLSLVFRKSRKENLSDFIGTDEAVKVGDSWKMAPEPLLGQFEKRGLKYSELEMDGKVSLSDRKSVFGYDCWIFNAFLNAKKSDEFEFDFRAEISLPADDRTGALKVSRTAVERLKKKMAKGHEMMPEIREISVEISDRMTAVSVPVRNGKDSR